ncbi:acyl-CoA dehydrogenase, C-terminal domain protein [Mycobacterium kansasii 732]|uniref:Acyl-CoA dehydrogenase FadE27 n=1 Tax=Mycobacterium pseudokansasii TaxID=2341080 RepID=A0A498QUG2_9MYCO|nr:acyl-CoA dehydrogenase family protein [Mycobacterium pseudokansasii]EUA12767.1 acyl-CoA dehydrogenase, C-terminal domain protein [Mycobacterium kansasii 732]KZS65555.1 acyl-CoA dehydrogenase [Mycobacterium kansasii]MBY0387309.1 acyl-CoA/acyl-ACP dehydrogenase [Mycobacterium pseudokansasii]VAZ98648.1 Acyl-CoA dehydrogenase FadE27 [Mycobacterium pseudokansasii]VBA29799.1 Acyl-CoA dehydrogenase FadE27 [Mycobacterium pseudokansasii]
MDVGLTSEQLALRDTVRDILRAECPPDVARQAITDPERWRGPWKTVVGLGWTELAAADSAGDFGPVALVLVLEECGAAIAPIPLLSSVGLAAGVLRACRLDDVLAEIAGGAVATLAVHSPGHRLPRPPMTLQHGRLRGHAVAVPNLVQAELIVTLATSDQGMVAAVMRAGDGVVIRPGESTDPAQPVADLKVDTPAVVTAPVAGIEPVLTAPLIAAAADLVGVASAVLQRAVEHAKTRHQFGTPIGAFQAIKHALADNYVSVERARSLTYAAAADPDVAWTTAALAKAAAGEAATRCARTAVQVHGALAQTWEHDIHLYVRHAWQGAAMLGDSRVLYHEVGRRFAGGAS